MLPKGWITPSSSPYVHTVLFSCKKDNSLYLCVDFLLLKTNTCRDQYPIPYIYELLDHLRRNCVFSSLHLQCGYHKICIAPEHQHRVAFACKFDLFEFKVIPFGLTNALNTFQWFMHEAFYTMSDFCNLYLNDIIVFIKSVPEHLEHVQAVLQYLYEKQI